MPCQPCLFVSFAHTWEESWSFSLQSRVSCRRSEHYCFPTHLFSIKTTCMSVHTSPPPPIHHLFRAVSKVTHPGIFCHSNTHPCSLLQTVSIETILTTLPVNAFYKHCKWHQPAGGETGLFRRLINWRVFNLNWSETSLMTLHRPIKLFNSQQ